MDNNLVIALIGPLENRLNALVGRVALLEANLADLDDELEESLREMNQDLHALNDRIENDI